MTNSAKDLSLMAGGREGEEGEGRRRSELGSRKVVEPEARVADVPVKLKISCATLCTNESTSSLYRSLSMRERGRGNAGSG